MRFIPDNHAANAPGGIKSGITTVGIHVSRTHHVRSVEKDDRVAARVGFLAVNQLHFFSVERQRFSVLVSLGGPVAAGRRKIEWPVGRRRAHDFQEVFMANDFGALHAFGDRLITARMIPMHVGIDNVVDLLICQLADGPQDLGSHGSELGIDEQDAIGARLHGHIPSGNR